MTQPVTISVPLKKLVEMAEAGEFAIPRLQRAFVWNGTKAAQLLDSVLRGLPIGGLTLWQASAKNAALLPNIHHILPKATARAHKYLVMDGQQRLSVLYNTFRGHERTNAQGVIVNFAHVCVRVDRADAGEPLTRYRRPEPGEWVSVAELVDSRTRVSRLVTNRVGQRRLLAYRKSLLAYKLPMTSVAISNLEAARDLFIRINSLGTRLAAADRAFARASRLDVKNAIHGLRSDLPPEFHALSFETLLQAFAMVSGMRDVGERAMADVVLHWNDRASTAEGKREWAKLVTDFSRATGRAIEFLRERGVVHSGVLPSQYLFAVLSVFFTFTANPSPAQKQKLIRWFWHTAFGNRYSGRGFRGNIVSDAERFIRLATKPATPLPKYPPIETSDLVRASLSRRSSTRDAVLCLLYLKRPVSLVDGVTRLVASPVAVTSKHHRHHVFPKALLARRGVKHNTDSICNIVLSPADANLQIGSKAPSDYFVVHKAHQRVALSASLLPGLVVDGATGRSQKMFNKFLVARASLLARDVNKLAGTQVIKP
jgi:hypothetical protein